MIAAREVGVKEDGSGGVALDEFQSFKIVVLTLLFGMASVVGAYSIGETTDQLITWFDNYVSVNGKGTEADSNDAKGTALQ